MVKVILSYGLAGGFGGISDYVVSEFPDNSTKEDWDLAAYELAVEKYENYAGYHGLESFNDILAENPDLDLELDQDLLESIYLEHIDNWLVYDSEIYTQEREEYFKCI